MKRKGQNTKIDSDIIEGYYSEEIISKFRSSKLFQHNPDANIKIRIHSSIEEIRKPVLTVIPNFLSIGIIPAITRTYGRLEFEIFDSENLRILKTYKYPVEQRIYFSSSSVILAPILTFFSDRFDHSLIERTFAIMRVAFNNFESDLSEDITKEKTLLEKFTIQKPGVYAIVPSQNFNDIEAYEQTLYKELESSLLNRGLKIVERKKLDLLLEEINFSRSGLTENNRNKLGTFLNADKIIFISDYVFSQKEVSPNNHLTSIQFTLKCLRVDTGEIVWTDTAVYDSQIEKSITIHFQSAVYPLISKLRDKGYL